MLTALVLMMAAPAAPPAFVNEKVEIDGRTYRVRVTDKLVKVFDKGSSWKKTVEQSKRMRRAVTKVTGCEMDNATWDGNHLAGFLDCSAKLPSAPQ